MHYSRLPRRFTSSDALTLKGSIFLHCYELDTESGKREAKEYKDYYNNRYI